MANLAAIQSNLGSNTNSVNIVPNFTSLVSPANLHLLTSSNYDINNIGIPVGGITIDFDCDVRLGTPDIGADEFSPMCSTIVVDNGNSINTPGTLRNLLSCIADGGTITFDAGVPTSFITAPLLINKNVTIQGTAAIDFDFSAPGLTAGPYGLRVAASKTVTLNNINIIDKNNPNATPPSAFPVIDLLGTLLTNAATTISKL
jgi:hypothetical protein